jgi:CRISPR-associated protein Cas5t
MIILSVEVPYASFRKSFARSFAETYSLPPPATIYGMLLSLVGEDFRARHENVKLAFAYKQMPRIATTLRKLSRYKYGIPSKQSTLGNAPDFVETLCEIEFLCWIDSSEESPTRGESLESRLLTALNSPHEINRRGIVSLGLSDDAVNEVSLCQQVVGKWHRLLPSGTGLLELPIWADHVSGLKTRYERYHFEEKPIIIETSPGTDNWRWTQIRQPN